MKKNRTILFTLLILPLFMSQFAKARPLHLCGTFVQEELISSALSGATLEAEAQLFNQIDPNARVKVCRVNAYGFNGKMLIVGWSSPDGSPNALTTATFFRDESNNRPSGDSVVSCFRRGVDYLDADGPVSLGYIECSRLASIANAKNGNSRLRCYAIPRGSSDSFCDQQFGPQNWGANMLRSSRD